MLTAEPKALDAALSMPVLPHLPDEAEAAGHSEVQLVRLAALALVQPAKVGPSDEPAAGVGFEGDLRVFKDVEYDLVGRLDGPYGVRVDAADMVLSVSGTSLSSV